MHERGVCHPCAFFWKKAGCENRQDCSFCHLCPPGEKKSRKKRARKPNEELQEPCTFGALAGLFPASQPMETQRASESFPLEAFDQPLEPGKLCLEQTSLSEVWELTLMAPPGLEAVSEAFELEPAFLGSSEINHWEAQNSHALPCAEMWRAWSDWGIDSQLAWDWQMWPQEDWHWGWQACQDWTQPPSPEPERVKIRLELDRILPEMPRPATPAPEMPAPAPAPSSPKLPPVPASSQLAPPPGLEDFFDPSDPPLAVERDHGTPDSESSLVVRSRGKSPSSSVETSDTSHLMSSWGFSARCLSPLGNKGLYPTDEMLTGKDARETDEAWESLFQSHPSMLLAGISDGC